MIRACLVFFLLQIKNDSEYLHQTDKDSKDSCACKKGLQRRTQQGFMTAYVSSPCSLCICLAGHFKRMAVSLLVYLVCGYLSACVNMQGLRHKVGAASESVCECLQGPVENWL